MKKFFIFFILFVFICYINFISNKNKKILFCNKEGNFKILVVSDPQCDTKKQWTEARYELEILIRRSNPNLIIINGDINSKNKVSAKMWEYFIYPATKRNIYWATTNGNHDPYNKINYNIYKGYKTCLNNTVNVTDPNYEYLRPMNFVLPIYSNNGKKIVFAIYCMDSGTKNNFGYEGLTKKQINWYKKQSNKLKELNNKKEVTSLLCIHIPLTQTLDMVYSLKNKGKTTRDYYGGVYKIYGVTNQSESNIKNYKCENGTIVTNSFINTTAPQNDNGMFNEILNNGDIKAIFFGHEHKTNIIGSYKGVLLGFAGKLSTGCYSDNLCRGGRVLEFNEANPQKFKVYWLGSMSTSKDQAAIYSDGTFVK